MSPLTDILEDLRAGKMIVLVDDEQRENEGDLVCAAEHVDPETVNFMLREGRGLLCVALTAERCRALDLGPQAPVNTTQRGTAFTVSVDAHARFGVGTGVSAADRATTVRRLADPDAVPADFDRPGHVHPLRARPGGALVRAGQTEGSVDLCRLAGLEPAAAIIEIMNEDGSMARLPELRELSGNHGLRMCSVADIIQYRLEREKLVERVDHAPFVTREGDFELFAYRSLVDPLPHVALACGELGRLDATGRPVELEEPVLVRMHSQNLLGDVFGDVQQPSGDTLHEAMRRIQEAGRGAVVYLRHEQMGTGLLKRLQTLHLPEDSRQAGDRPALGREHATPGRRPPADKGSYGIGAQILRDLGIRRMRLMTDHPFVPTALDGYGLQITEFVPITESPPG